MTLRLARSILLVSSALAVPASGGAPGALVRGRVALPSGAAAAGARVEAFPRFSEAEAGLRLDQREEPKPAAVSTAGKDGAFVLRVPAGSFRVAISADGFARVEAEEELAAGEEDDLPAIRLSPASALSGRVVDASGRPVEGALVALSGEEEDGGIKESTEARTDKEGRFRCGNASADALGVQVRARGRAPLSASIESLTTDSGGLVLKMQSGAHVSGVVRTAGGSPAADAIVSASGHAVRTGADGRWSLEGVSAGRAFVAASKGNLAASSTLSLSETGQAETNLVLGPSAMVEGTVIDAKNRRPLPGVTVFAGSARARSDRKGAFQLPGLAPDSISLRAAKRGYSPAPSRELTLSAGARVPVSLALFPAARFSGKVVGDDGKPVAGARVRVEREELWQLLRRARRMAAAGASSRTDSAGAFALFTEGGGPAVGLSARARDFAEGSLGGLRAGPGETKSGLVIRLSRGASATGLVVREDGTGVPDAEVKILPEASGPAGRGARFAARFQEVAGSSAPRSKTDAQGKYRFDHLLPGTAVVFVEASTFSRHALHAVVIQKTGTTEIAKIVLHPAAAIDGTVADSAGKAISGALVSGNSPNNHEQGETDASGHYRLTGFAPGERLFVRAEAAGHAPARREIQAPAAGVSFTLSSDGTLVGRVSDAASGNPLTTFSIGRIRAAGPGRFGGGPNGAQEEEIHSPDGNFELPDVPPGTWTFTASASGHQTQTLSAIEIGEGARTERIAFELKAGLSLTGHVVEAESGTPVPDATVQASSPGSGPNPFARLGLSGGGPTAVTEADGSFRLDDLSPGSLVVTAQDDFHVPGQLTVDPAAQNDVVLKLSGGGSISGGVISSDGKSPAAGAQVTLIAEGNPQMAVLLAPQNPTTADSSGGFLFDHLAAGRYALRAASGSASSPSVETVLNPGQAQAGVVISLQGGTRVSGHVTGLSSADVSSVQVAASGSSGFFHVSAADAAGAYEVDGVPAGPLQLVARVISSARRTASTSVQVEDGSEEMTVDIAFPSDGSLSGRVTKNGAAVAGERVVALPSPGSSATSTASAESDGAGAYQIAGLDNGDYDVRAQGPGGAARRTVSISGETALDIDLPVISLSGSVVEAGSNEPVEGVNVSLDSGSEMNASSMKRAATDSLGKFQIADVDAADYQLSAQKQGWQTSTQPLSVTDTISGLSIALTRAQGITLVVSDGLTGFPLSGYHATVFSSAGAIAFDGALAADNTGRSEIPQLAPGVYVFYVFGQGYATFIAPQVSIPCPPLQLALTPGGALVLRVEASASGVPALLTTAGGLPYLRSSFNLTGVFRLQPTAIPHVAPGSYTLTVQYPAGARTYPVQISEGTQTLLSLP